jgi:hypothetical protein
MGPKRVLLLTVPLLAMVAVPARATLILGSGNTYVLGTEDSVGGDYDYNDLMFSVTSNATMTMDTAVAASLYLPPAILPFSNTPPPFWNHTSSDGTNENFGDCVYTTDCDAGTSTGTGPGVHPTAALDPTGEYIASTTGQNSVSFDFTTTGTVTVTLLGSITAVSTEAADLYWCPDGTSNTGSLSSACKNIGLGGTLHDTATFTPDGAFDLVLAIGSGSSAPIFDSEMDLGKSDTSIDHFAVVTGVPEPATLALVGVALVGLGTLRARAKKKR